MKSQLILLEGIERSGKTTLAQNLKTYCETQGYSVCLTKEPGGTKLGERLKTLLLEEEVKLFDLSELFLFLADRAQHIEEVINPALERGEVVICDRFSLSTLAYQGVKSPFSIEELIKLEKRSRSNLKKVITFQFLLDLPVVEAFNRKGKEDRIERKELAFHEKVRSNFLMYKDSLGFDDTFTLDVTGKTKEKVLEDTIYKMEIEKDVSVLNVILSCQKNKYKKKNNE